MHAPAVASIAETELAAVCDPDRTRAAHLAEEYGIPHTFASVEEAVRAGSFEFAHVLVPPDRHVEVALELAAAGIGILIEKPMGRSVAECESVLSAATEHGVQVGVNHNSLFYPAYVKLRRAVAERRLGRLQHLEVTLIRPRHWLAVTPPWLQDDPACIAYEAVIHPLAQVYDLAGAPSQVTTITSGCHEFRGGGHFCDTWQLSLVCERATAQLTLTYGNYWLYRVMAICEDGAVVADVEANRCIAFDRTRWGRTRFGRFLEPLHVATRVAGQELRQGFENMTREARSIRPASVLTDIYLISMRDSIAAFHRGPNVGQPKVDGEFGKQVVVACDQATREVGDALPHGRRTPRSKRLGHPDAAVLGGTGTIGRALIERMTADGMTVRVMARHTAALPRMFDRSGIEVVQGDLADPAAVSDATRGSRAVVHLADSRHLVSWWNVDSSVVKPAEVVAESCVRNEVERLVCAGSMMSLYLGDANSTVTGSSAVDLGASTASPWDWGKAHVENTLLSFARAHSLRLCILRPGIVLGEGGTPFHPGYGIWRGETHCVGWNRGANPLPLVLASDVAAAITLALASELAAVKTYNVVGDVRLSARECIDGFRAALARPLVFHPAHPAQHHALAVAKWSATALRRREERPFPTYRAFVSKGCESAFDCSDVKRELGWEPVVDHGEFIERAFWPAAVGRTWG